MGKRQQNTSDQNYSLNKLMSNFIGVFKDEFFWFTDNSGKTYFSENLFDVTGYSSDEINSLQEIIFKDDLIDYKRALSALENNSPKDEISFESRIVHKDKKIIWLSLSLKVFRDENSKINRCVGRAIDISQKKIRESELEDENENLKKQNFAKNKFLNLLSHDLKSPFTSILGFTEILMKENSLSESERDEYLSYIYDSSEKLLKLINYLLDWSKLQSGKLQIDTERISVQGLVYNSVSSLTGTAVRKDVDIKVDIDNSLNARGDERLLGIVMTNLLNNAIKYSQSNSNIYVKAESFNEDFIEFTVKDDGVGIPENHKNKMFKIESMFSTEGTKGERGTGFGLTFSKEIIERHGGELWFYSEEGNGSEFHFTIPSSSESILIVELEHGLREFMVKTIKKEYPGKTILTKTVNELLDNSGRISPSVIILSHENPLINGAQLIETLFKNSKHSGLKIIVIVEEITGELENVYKEFGEAVFVPKLDARKQFAVALQQVIS
jgi:two-component system, sensor histidine kinase and response regulator